MQTKDVQIYFLFRCDDKNRPSDMPPDLYLHLYDYEKVKNKKEELDSLSINYDLVIERFYEKTNEVLSNDYIVENNHLNA